MNRSHRSIRALGASVRESAWPVEKRNALTARAAVVRASSLFAGWLLTVSLGGCPVAQRPTDPDDQATNRVAPDFPQGDSGLPRPILSPPPAGSTSDPNSVVPNLPAEWNGAGEPAGPSVGILAPTVNRSIRLGAPIPIEYRVRDETEQIVGLWIVLARDGDGDGEPDGDPVVSVSVGVARGLLSSSVSSERVRDIVGDAEARFVVGVRFRTADGANSTRYAPGSVRVDGNAPVAEWIAPAEDELINRDRALEIRLETRDTSGHSVQILADPDTQPLSGNERELIGTTQFPAGAHGLGRDVELSRLAAGTYHYFVVVSDGVRPPAGFYARSAGAILTFVVTNRLVGEFDLEQLSDSSDGAILHGFNFNDLAGSSMAAVPDVNGDGLSELIVVARFGKPYIINAAGVGFGEAYLVYGNDQQRLRGLVPLNTIGRSPRDPTYIPGLIFPGIRSPLNTSWTAGISDVAVVPDMDGDDAPEIVFSFPRVESISLAVTEPTIQHPELLPDLPGVGTLEYNAYSDSQWHPNLAQFTRGGIVIVSSHDELLRDPERLNRKADRVVDLHEVGQVFSGFSGMSRPQLVPYIRQALRRDELDPPRSGPFLVCVDCDGLPPSGCDPNVPNACGNDGCVLNGTTTTDGRETAIQRWVVQWDVIFAGQGPGGFFSQWTPIPADPPLANNMPFPFGPGVFPFAEYPNHWVASGDACDPDVRCEVTNEWFEWTPEAICGGAFAWFTGGSFQQDPLPECYPDNPCPIPGSPPPCGEPEPLCFDPPMTVDAGGTVVWSGFYGPCSQAYVSLPTGEEHVTAIGARILGQRVEDRFGTSVSSDGTWLYISAPRRTPNDEPYFDDVPSLAERREDAGVVYQLRTYAPQQAGGVTRTQLWIEPQPSLRPGPPCLPTTTAAFRPWWPYVDTELGFRTDYTMPVPHTYMIEVIGSLSGNPGTGMRDTAFGDPNNPNSCPPPYDPGVDAPDLSACRTYFYPPGTAGYYVDRTPQIVGPHPDARIEFVRALGDVNGDGVRDFGVGSASVRADVIGGTGESVGAIFIIYGRPTGLEGDYLLDQLALDISAPGRLTGVLLKGASAGETLARVFDDAGDFNGDGYADVLIGNEGAGGGAGEAVVLFGSRTLVSPGANDPGGAPGGGWTPASIPADRAVRFTGVAVGDRAGANVAGAGDVDGDGLNDLLIAAPGANGGRGVVYLIYGDRRFSGEIRLADVGSVRVPGVRFVGRAVGDFLGGGTKHVANTAPNGGATDAFSRGVAALGDIDGDGRGDFALSAMLADALGHTDAGEVYILYGRGD